MTSDEYKTAKSRLGLSHSEMDAVLGMESSRRWAMRGVNGPAEILIALLLAGKITLGDIEATNRIEY